MGKKNKTRPTKLVRIDGDLAPFVTTGVENGEPIGVFDFGAYTLSDKYGEYSKKDLFQYWDRNDIRPDFSLHEENLAYEADRMAYADIGSKIDRAKKEWAYRTVKLDQAVTNASFEYTKRIAEEVRRNVLAGDPVAEEIEKAEAIKENLYKTSVNVASGRARDFLQDVEQEAIHKNNALVFQYGVNGLETDREFMQPKLEDVVYEKTKDPMAGMDNYIDEDNMIRNISDHPSGQLNIFEKALVKASPVMGVISNAMPVPGMGGVLRAINTIYKISNPNVKETFLDRLDPRALATNKLYPNGKALEWDEGAGYYRERKLEDIDNDMNVYNSVSGPRYSKKGILRFLEEFSDTMIGMTQSGEVLGNITSGIMANQLPEGSALQQYYEEEKRRSDKYLLLNNATEFEATRQEAGLGILEGSNFGANMGALTAQLVAVMAGGSAVRGMGITSKLLAQGIPTLPLSAYASAEFDKQARNVGFNDEERAMLFGTVFLMTTATEMTGPNVLYKGVPAGKVWNKADDFVGRAYRETLDAYSDVSSPAAKVTLMSKVMKGLRRNQILAGSREEFSEEIVQGYLEDVIRASADFMKYGYDKTKNEGFFPEYNYAIDKSGVGNILAQSAELAKTNNYYLSEGLLGAIGGFGFSAYSSISNMKGVQDFKSEEELISTMVASGQAEDLKRLIKKHGKKSDSPNIDMNGKPVGRFNKNASKADAYTAHLLNTVELYEKAYNEIGKEAMVAGGFFGKDGIKAAVDIKKIDSQIKDIQAKAQTEERELTTEEEAQIKELQETQKQKQQIVEDVFSIEEGTKYSKMHNDFYKDLIIKNSFAREKADETYARINKKNVSELTGNDRKTKEYAGYHKLYLNIGHTLRNNADYVVSDIERRTKGDESYLDEAQKKADEILEIAKTNNFTKAQEKASNLISELINIAKTKKAYTKKGAEKTKEIINTTQQIIAEFKNRSAEELKGVSIYEEADEEGKAEMAANQAASIVDLLASMDEFPLFQSVTEAGETEKEGFAVSMLSDLDEFVAMLDQERANKTEESPYDKSDQAKMLYSLAKENIQRIHNRINSLEYFDHLDKNKAHLRDNLTEDDQARIQTKEVRERVKNDLRELEKKIDHEVGDLAAAAKVSSETDYASKGARIETRRRFISSLFELKDVRKALGDDLKKFENLLMSMTGLDVSNLYFINSETGQIQRNDFRTIEQGTKDAVDELELLIEKAEDILTAHSDGVFTEKTISALFEQLSGGTDTFDAYRNSLEDDNGLYTENLLETLTEMNKRLVHETKGTDPENRGIAGASNIKLKDRGFGAKGKMVIDGKIESGISGDQILIRPLISWITSVSSFKNADMHKTLKQIYDTFGTEKWMIPLTYEQEETFRFTLASNMTSFDGKNIYERIFKSILTEEYGYGMIEDEMKGFYKKMIEGSNRAVYIKGVYGSGKTVVTVPFYVAGMKFLESAGLVPDAFKLDNIRIVYHTDELKKEFKKMLSPIADHFNVEINYQHTSDELEVNGGQANYAVSGKDVDLVIWDEAGLLPRKKAHEVIAAYNTTRNKKEKDKVPFHIFMGDKTQMVARPANDIGDAHVASAAKILPSSPGLTRSFSTNIWILEDLADKIGKGEPLPEWKFERGKDGTLWGTQVCASVSEVIDNFERETRQHSKEKNKPIIVFPIQNAEYDRLKSKYPNQVYVLQPDIENKTDDRSIQGLRRKMVYLAYDPKNIVTYNNDKIKYYGTDELSSAYTGVTRASQFVSIVGSSAEAESIWGINEIDEISPSVEPSHARQNELSQDSEIVFKKNVKEETDTEEKVETKKTKDVKKKVTGLLDSYVEGKTRAGNPKFTLVENAFRHQVNLKSNTSYLLTTMKINGEEITLSIPLHKKKITDANEIIKSKNPSSEIVDLIQSLVEELDSRNLTGNFLSLLDFAIGLSQNQEVSFEELISESENEQAYEDGTNQIKQDIISEIGYNSFEIRLQDGSGRIIRYNPEHKDAFILNDFEIPSFVVNELMFGKGIDIDYTISPTDDVASDDFTETTDSIKIIDVNIEKGSTVTLDNGTDYTVVAIGENSDGESIIRLADDSGSIDFTYKEFINSFDANSYDDGVKHESSQRTADKNVPVKNVILNSLVKQYGSNIVWGSFDTVVNLEGLENLPEGVLDDIRTFHWILQSDQSVVARLFFKKNQSYIANDGSINTSQNVIDVVAELSDAKINKLVSKYKLYALSEYLASNKNKDVYTALKTITSLSKVQLKAGESIAKVKNGQQILEESPRQKLEEMIKEGHTSEDGQQEAASAQIALMHLYRDLMESETKKTEKFTLENKQFYIAGLNRKSNEGVLLTDFISNAKERFHSVEVSYVGDSGSYRLSIKITPRAGMKKIEVLTGIWVQNDQIGSLGRDVGKDVLSIIKNDISNLSKAKTLSEFNKIYFSSFLHHLLVNNRSLIQDSSFKIFKDLRGMIYYSKDQPTHAKISDNRPRNKRILMLKADKAGYKDVVDYLSENREVLDYMYFPVINDGGEINQRGFNVLKVSSGMLGVPSGFFSLNNVFPEKTDRTDETGGEDKGDERLRFDRKIKDKRIVRAEIRNFNRMLARILGEDASRFVTEEGQDFDGLYEVFGMLREGRMRINLKEGEVKYTTPRHEIFHWMLNHVFDDTTFDNIIVAGKAEMLKQKKWASYTADEITNEEVDEYLADLYSSLYSGKEVKGVKGNVLELFSHIKRIERKLFKVKPELDEIFSKIESGIYASRGMQHDRLGGAIRYDSNHGENIEDDENEFTINDRKFSFDIEKDFGGNAQFKRFSKLVFKNMLMNSFVYTENPKYANNSIEDSIEDFVKYMKNKKGVVYDGEGNIRKDYAVFENRVVNDIFEMSVEERNKYIEYLFADEAKMNDIMDYLLPGIKQYDSIQTRKNNQKTYDASSSKFVKLILGSIRYYDFADGNINDNPEWKNLQFVNESRARILLLKASESLRKKDDIANALKTNDSANLSTISLLSRELETMANEVNMAGEDRNNMLSIVKAFDTITRNVSKSSKSFDSIEGVNNFINKTSVIDRLASIHLNSVRRNSINIYSDEDSFTPIVVGQSDTEEVKNNLKDNIVSKLFHEDVASNFAEKLNERFSFEGTNDWNDGWNQLNVMVGDQSVPIAERIVDGKDVYYRFIEPTANSRILLESFASFGYTKIVDKQMLLRIFNSSESNNPFKAYDLNKNQKIKTKAFSAISGQNELQSILAGTLLESVNSLNHMVRIKEKVSEEDKTLRTIINEVKRDPEYQYIENFNSKMLNSSGSFDIQQLLGIEGSKKAIKFHTPADFFKVFRILGDLRTHQIGTSGDIFNYLTTNKRIQRYTKASDLTLKFNTAINKTVSGTALARFDGVYFVESLKNKKTNKVTEEPVAYDYANTMTSLFFESMLSGENIYIPITNMADKGEPTIMSMKKTKTSDVISQDDNGDIIEMTPDEELFNTLLDERFGYYERMHKESLNRWKRFIEKENLVALSGKKPFYNMAGSNRDQINGAFKQFAINLKRQKGGKMIDVLRKSSEETPLIENVDFIIDSNGLLRASDDVLFDHDIFSQKNNKALKRAKKELTTEEFNKYRDHLFLDNIINDYKVTVRESGYSPNTKYMPKGFYGENKLYKRLTSYDNKNLKKLTSSLSTAVGKGEGVDVNPMLKSFFYYRVLAGTQFEDFAFGHVGLYKNSNDWGKRVKTYVTPEDRISSNHKYTFGQRVNIIPFKDFSVSSIVNGKEEPIEMDDGGSLMSSFGAELYRISMGAENAPFGNGPKKPVYNGGTNDETGLNMGLKFSANSITRSTLELSDRQWQIEEAMLDTWSRRVNEKIDVDIPFNGKAIYMKHLQREKLNIRNATIKTLDEIQAKYPDEFEEIKNEIVFAVVPDDSIKYGKRNVNDHKPWDTTDFMVININVADLGHILNLSEETTDHKGRLVPYNQTQPIMALLDSNSHIESEELKKKIFDYGVSKIQEDIFKYSSDYKNKDERLLDQLSQYMRDLVLKGVDINSSDARFIDQLIDERISIRTPTVAEKVRQTFRSYVSSKLIRTGFDGFRATQVSSEYTQLYKVKGYGSSKFTLHDMHKYFGITRQQIRQIKDSKTFKANGEEITVSKYNLQASGKVSDNEMYPSDVIISNPFLKQFHMNKSESLNDFYRIEYYEKGQYKQELLGHKSDTDIAKRILTVIKKKDIEGFKSPIVRHLLKSKMDLSFNNISKIVREFNSSLESVAIRIPTGKGGQITKIKTIAFANDIGNAMMFPPGNNIFTDSDYDGDQVSVYLKHRDKRGIKITGDNTAEGLQNQMLDALSKAINNGANVIDKKSNISDIVAKGNKEADKKVMQRRGFSESLVNWKKSLSGNKAVGIQANAVSVSNAILNLREDMPEPFKNIDNLPVETKTDVLNLIGDWLQAILDNEKTNVLGNFSITRNSVNLLTAFILKNADTGFSRKQMIDDIYDFFNNDTFVEIFDEMEESERLDQFGSKYIYQVVNQKKNRLFNDASRIRNELLNKDSNERLSKEDYTKLLEIKEKVKKENTKIREKWDISERNIRYLSSMIREFSVTDKMISTFAEAQNYEDSKRTSDLEEYIRNNKTQLKEHFVKRMNVNSALATDTELDNLEKLEDYLVIAEGMRRISHFISVRGNIKALQSDFEDYVHKSSLYFGQDIDIYKEALANNPDYRVTKEEYLDYFKNKSNAYRGATERDVQESLLEFEGRLYDDFNMDKLISRGVGFEGYYKQLDAYINPYFFENVYPFIEDTPGYKRLKEMFMDKLSQGNWSNKEQRQIFTTIVNNLIVDNYFKNIPNSRSTFTIIPFDLNVNGKPVLKENPTSGKSLKEIYTFNPKDSKDAYKTLFPQIFDFLKNTLASANLSESDVRDFYSSIMKDGEAYYDKTIKPIRDDLLSENNNFINELEIRRVGQADIVSLGLIEDSRVDEFKNEFKTIKTKELKDMFVFYSLILSKFNSGKNSMSSLIPNEYYYEEDGINNSIETLFETMERDDLTSKQVDDLIRFISSNARAVKMINPEGKTYDAKQGIGTLPVYYSGKEKRGRYTFDVAYEETDDGPVRNIPLTNTQIFSMDAERNTVSGLDVYRGIDSDDLLRLSSGKKVIKTSSVQKGYESGNYAIPGGIIVNIESFNDGKILEITKSKQTISDAESVLSNNTYARRNKNVAADENFVNQFDSGVFSFMDIESGNMVGVYNANSEGMFNTQTTNSQMSPGGRLFTGEKKARLRKGETIGVYNELGQQGMNEKGTSYALNKTVVETEIEGETISEEKLLKEEVLRFLNYADQHRDKQFAYMQKIDVRTKFKNSPTLQAFFEALEAFKSENGRVPQNIRFGRNMAFKLNEKLDPDFKREAENIDKYGSLKPENVQVEIRTATGELITTSIKDAYQITKISYEELYWKAYSMDPSLFLDVFSQLGEKGFYSSDKKTSYAARILNNIKNSIADSEVLEEFASKKQQARVGEDGIELLKNLIPGVPIIQESDASSIRENKTVKFAWTDKQGIHVNMDRFTPEIPMHEFQHIANQWLRQYDTATYEKLVQKANNLIESGDRLSIAIWEKIKKNNPKAKDAELMDEFISTYAGIVSYNEVLKLMAEYDIIESAETQKKELIDNIAQRSIRLSKAIANTFNEVETILGKPDADMDVSNMTLLEYAANMIKNHPVSEENIHNALGSMTENQKMFLQQDLITGQNTVKTIEELSLALMNGRSSNVADYNIADSKSLARYLFNKYAKFKPGKAELNYRGETYNFDFINTPEGAEKVITEIMDRVVPEMKKFERDYPNNIKAVLEFMVKGSDVTTAFSEVFGKGFDFNQATVERFEAVVGLDNNVSRILRYSELKEDFNPELASLYDPDFVGNDPIVIVHAEGNKNNPPIISILDVTSTPLTKRPYGIKDKNLLGVVSPEAEFKSRGGDMTNSNGDLRKLSLGLLANHMLNANSKLSITSMNVVGMTARHIDVKTIADLSGIRNNLRAMSETKISQDKKFTDIISNEKIKGIIDDPKSNIDFAYDKLKNIYHGNIDNSRDQLRDFFDDKTLTRKQKIDTLKRYLQYLEDKNPNNFKHIPAYQAASKLLISLSSDMPNVLEQGKDMGWLESKLVGAYNSKNKIIQLVFTAYQRAMQSIRNKHLQYQDEINPMTTKLINQWRYRNPGKAGVSFLFDYSSAFFEDMFIKAKARKDDGSYEEVRTYYLHYDKNDPRTAEALRNGTITEMHLEYANKIIKMTKDIWVDNILYQNRKKDGYTKKDALRDYQNEFEDGNIAPIMDKTVFELLFSKGKNRKAAVKKFTQNLSNDAKLFEDIYIADMDNSENEIMNGFLSQRDPAKRDEMIGLEQIDVKIENGYKIPIYRLANRDANKGFSTNIYNSFNYFSLASIRKPILEDKLMPLVSAADTTLSLMGSDKHGDNMKQTRTYLERWVDRNVNKINADLQANDVFSINSESKNLDKVQISMSTVIRGLIRAYTFLALGYNVPVGLKSYGFNTVQQVMLGASYSAQKRIGENVQKKVAASIEEGREVMFSGKSFAKAQALFGGGLESAKELVGANSNFKKYYKIARKLGVVQHDESDLIESYLMNKTKRHLGQAQMAQTANLATDIYARVSTMYAVMDTEGSLGAYDYDFKSGEVTYDVKKDRRFYTKEGTIKKDNGEDAIMNLIKENVNDEFGLGVDEKIKFGHDAKLVTDIRRVTDKYVIGSMSNDVKPLISNHYAGALLSQFRLFSLEKLWNAGVFASKRETSLGAGYKAVQDEDGTWIAKEDVIQIEGYWQTVGSMFKILGKGNGVTLKSWWNEASDNRKMLFIRGIIRLASAGLAFFAIRGFGDDEDQWKYKWLWSDFFDAFMITEIYENPVPAFDFIHNIWEVMMGDREFKHLMSIVPGSSNKNIYDDVSDKIKQWDEEGIGSSIRDFDLNREEE